MFLNVISISYQPDFVVLVLFHRTAFAVEMCFIVYYLLKLNQAGNTLKKKVLVSAILLTRC